MFESSSDSDVLDMALLYFGSLRDILPSERLKDCCAGVCALVFELSSFLTIHKEYHGNY